MGAFPAVRGHFIPCPCWEQGLDTSHRCQLVGMEVRQGQEGCGICLSPGSQLPVDSDGSAWQGLAPSKPCPSSRCAESRSLMLFVTWEKWQQRGHSPSKPSCPCPQPRAQQSSGGAGKQLTELIYSWFTPCCCPDPLAQRTGVTRHVGLPTCRHSPAHSSALLPLITLRAEGLTAAILFPATLQMIQHNKTYNSPLEKRKL